MQIVWFVIAGVAVLFLAVVLRGAPYVPSRKRDLERAFQELYELGPEDVVVDIGSGDGIVLRAAAARGARAIGFELNPVLVVIARWLSRRDAKVSVRFADAWLSSLPAPTTIVYVFSTGRDIERIGRWVDAQATRLGRPFYLMSYGFTLDRPVLRSAGAHYLYRIVPLQASSEHV